MINQNNCLNDIKITTLIYYYIIDFISLFIYNTTNFWSIPSFLSYDPSEKIKPISVHVPTHLKPLGDKNFGHYLAGLIDGEGYISPFSITISFNILDASLAYYIKKRIGLGKVSSAGRIKNKKAVIYSLYNKEGIEKVLCLINEKIRSHDKFAQINRLLSEPRYSLLNSQLDFKLNSSEDLDNYWLAGFSDAALPSFFGLRHQNGPPAGLLAAGGLGNRGSFQIKISSRNDIRPRTEVRLAFQIWEKEDILLKKIPKLLGGNIGYRKSKDTYYYSSTSFGSAKKVISYFDKYHLLSSKHVNYLKWRKAYCKLMTNESLTYSEIISKKNKHLVQTASYLSQRRNYSTKIPKSQKHANSHTFRNQILLGNKGRSGIYMWTNLINKKRYVGSSADLSRRFREYYDKKRLLKESSMAIYRALLKYGFGLRLAPPINLV